jgi:hypothetical protein
LFSLAQLSDTFRFGFSQTGLGLFSQAKEPGSGGGSTDVPVGTGAGAGAASGEIPGVTSSGAGIVSSRAGSTSSGSGSPVACAIAGVGAVPIETKLALKIPAETRKALERIGRLNVINTSKWRIKCKNLLF